MTIDGTWVGYSGTAHIVLAVVLGRRGSTAARGPADGTRVRPTAYWPGSFTPCWATICHPSGRRTQTCRTSRVAP